MSRSSGFGVSLSKSVGFRSGRKNCVPGIISVAVSMRTGACGDSGVVGGLENVPQGF